MTPATLHKDPSPSSLNSATTARLIGGYILAVIVAAFVGTCTFMLQLFSNAYGMSYSQLYHKLMLAVTLFPFILLVVAAQSLVTALPLIAYLHLSKRRTLQAALVAGACSAFLPWIFNGFFEALILLPAGAAAGAAFWAFAWRRTEPPNGNRSET